MIRIAPVLLAFSLSAASVAVASAESFPPGPYDRQVAEHVARLGAEQAKVRAGAAEALGFLRAYEAEPALLERLIDPSAEVRRQVAMALAWCGGRSSVTSLLQALDDEDWVTRQAAQVSLTNLTGMEYPFHATASPERRSAQTDVWRAWWATVPPDRPPVEVLALLEKPKNLALGRPATVSTAYRGSPEQLTDGRVGPEFWQTKNVAFPQWCVIDLEQAAPISQVIVHQHGPALAMTEYELAVSLDNVAYEVVRRAKGPTEVQLVIDFPPRSARYVRMTSLGCRLPAYPTTFLEVEVLGPAQRGAKGGVVEPAEWLAERGLRALGVLGGKGATQAILQWLGPEPPTSPTWRLAARAGIRSLGRLRDEAGREALLGWLDNTTWARAAADALGDFGDARAVPHLLSVYPRYAKQLDGRYPSEVPADDRWGAPPSAIGEDRMLETPYAISYALCRLPLDAPTDRRSLRRLAPLVMANLPRDQDRFMVYETAVPDLLTRHLMEHSGLRQEACEHAFELLGLERRAPKPADAPEWPKPPKEVEEVTADQREAACIATWLPVLCTEKDDLPRLIALLEHDEGWVRINAAKTLALLDDRRAVEPIARLLESAKAEADFGYCGTFKFDEYNDPAPRWREALVRALGLLGAHEHTELLVQILEDERSVLGARYAAAQALTDLMARGENSRAQAALAEAAFNHPFESIRHLACDAHQIGEIALPRKSLPPTPETPSPPSKLPPQEFLAMVFIKGEKRMPNDVGTVELADRWRRTYVYTDPGPTYRPGRNLFVLRPPQPEGEVTALTNFSDGYVADLELSWDGTEAIFSRRGEHDPWWHVWRINLDGSGLRQVTHGPYHDVGPAWLPDGRIVFSSTRSGILDEYHGYQCNALYVMNPDGTGIERIATNAGRDNEPAVLNDGRIAFCRLEMFYARIKTELTLHAVHPDGTQDVVLYGPERRAFWHRLDYSPRERLGLVENPPMFGVLRMTQPQAMPDGRNILVATQGGLALAGAGLRDRETIITRDNKTRVYTTPFPLPDGRVLCASASKEFDHEKIDMGLYLLDPAGGDLELIYNDPATADFEPRPVLARPRPPVMPKRTTPGAYSGRFLCSSVFATQEESVPQRGRLVRLVEGMPVVARHSTHTNLWPVWKNHHGLFARVLGTAPLAPDGSFYVEVPADRLVHFQVLDSDRQVVGNQLTWIYSRPGEVKSCVGCHENPHTTPRIDDPIALHYQPVNFLPQGQEFSYRAKAWMKGYLPPEVEERMRTVRAVNLLGR